METNEEVDFMSFLNSTEQFVQNVTVEPLESVLSTLLQNRDTHNKCYKIRDVFTVGQPSDLFATEIIYSNSSLISTSKDGPKKKRKGVDSDDKVWRFSVVLWVPSGYLVVDNQIHILSVSVPRVKRESKQNEPETNSTHTSVPLLQGDVNYTNVSMFCADVELPVKKREGKIPVLHYVICTLTNGSTQLQFQTSPLALAAVSNTTAQRKETEANLLFVSPTAKVLNKISIDEAVFVIHKYIELPWGHPTEHLSLLANRFHKESIRVLLLHALVKLQNCNNINNITHITYDQFILCKQAICDKLPKLFNKLGGASELWREGYISICEQSTCERMLRDRPSGCCIVRLSRVFFTALANGLKHAQREQAALGPFVIVTVGPNNTIAQYNPKTSTLQQTNLVDYILSIPDLKMIYNSIWELKPLTQLTPLLNSKKKSAVPRKTPTILSKNPEYSGSFTEMSPPTTPASVDDLSSDRSPSMLFGELSLQPTPPLPLFETAPSTPPTPPTPNTTTQSLDVETLKTQQFFNMFAAYVDRDPAQFSGLVERLRNDMYDTALNLLTVNWKDYQVPPPMAQNIQVFLSKLTQKAP